MKTPNKTKGTALFLTLVACFMLSNSSSNLSSKIDMKPTRGDANLTLCHNGRNITVSNGDVRLHLRHGDRVGGCHFAA